MSNKTSHIVLKWTLGTIVGLMVLVGVARLSLKSAWVHGKIKDFAVAKVEDQFGADFKIGRLSGDLWKELTLSDMNFELGDQRLHLDTLSVHYRLPDLIFGVKDVESVMVSGVQLSWNQQTAEGLFPQEDTTQTEESEPLQFAIESFTLTHTNADIFAPDILPDSTLAIRELGLEASFSMLEAPELWLKQLSFKLESGSLPSPIAFSVDGALKDEEITLNNLLVETGRSALKAQLEANTDGREVQASVASSPLALQDFAPLVDIPLASENLDLQVKVGGSLEQLSASLLIDHPALQKSELSVELTLGNEPALTSASFQSAFINPVSFLPELPSASVRNMRLATKGRFPFSDMEASNLEWEFQAETLRYDTLQLKKASSTGRLKNQLVKGSAELISMADERVSVSAEVDEVFSDSARWEVSASVLGFDVSNWVPESESTNISLFASLKGFGYALPDYGWRYSLGNKNPKKGKLIPLRFGDITANEFRVDGEFGLLNTSVNSLIRLRESTLKLDAELHDVLSENVEHNYSLSLENVNLSELIGSEDFSTNINGLVSSSGEGNSVEKMNAAGSIDLDESLINGALLQNFSGEFSLSNGILNINNGELKSEIADGSIEGRKNLMDFRDSENRLSMDLILKDPQPFAPLAGFTIMQGQGKLSGDILQDSGGVLTSDFQLNLTNIRLDTLLVAPAISGSANSVLAENKTFELHFNISEPEIMGMAIQDVTLDMDGNANDTELDASFSFDVISSERGRLEQRGNIHSLMIQSIIDVEFTAFDFISEQSTLRLQEPFHIRMAEELFGTDTLKLASTTGAYMKLMIPYASPSQQKIVSSGSNFDLGLIQDILFGQRMVEGVVSGTFDIDRDEETVTGNGNLDFVQVNYQGVEADSIKLGYSIASERLKLNGSMFWSGGEQVRGNVNLPFVLDETLLDDEFYKRKVSGELTIKPTSLDRFYTLMEQVGIDNTTGILSFSGSIGGVAGNPVFNGELEIEDPVLSGVPVDELLTRFNYNNANKELRIKSEIFALGATMAELDVAYPIDYDFRTFTLNDMAKEDEIKILAKSTNLDLALFNDFLDPNYMRSLSGVLNADVLLSGTLGDISPKGFIELKNTRINIPFAGIILKNISAEVDVQEDRMNIKKITASSGPGTFSANGSIMLDGITPTNINVNTRARRFLTSNTDNTNLIMDMDAKLTGEAIRPKMTGNVEVQSGFYYQQDFGNELVEEVYLEDEEEPTFSPFDSLSMDMTLKIGENFYIRTRDYLDAELEIEGELDMLKDKGEEVPSLFGALKTSEGYINPLGKRFDVESANLIFSGPFDNPELDIRSSYTPQTRQKGESVQLYYVITGTANDPKFDFESDPYMEQSDIICYTLFNKPCYSLDSWQSVLAGGGNTGAMDVLTDVLLDQVESLATRELGVDVVQIDNSGSSGATAIKTGWYLNERTFFAIVNEITNSTPKTLFILEYILNENWDLIVTQGDDDRQGVDIRYQFDY